MAVPNTFASATSPIPLANLDANFVYYDSAFTISGNIFTFIDTVKYQDITDPTKIGQFDFSGITTATTRTYTFPNITGTLATTATLTQTFTGTTTFSGTFTASGTTTTLGSGTGAITANVGSGATTNGTTKTVNIGTAGVSGSITNINIGSAVSGATGTATINSLETITKGYRATAPITINAATYTQTVSDYSLIVTTTAPTITLLSAASYTGKVLYIKNITATAVTSASANVVPLGSATAGTAILAATAGKFAMLQSDGTNWITMMAN
jgi:hypothetical protein